jgi:hypothetical protein
MNVRHKNINWLFFNNLKNVTKTNLQESSDYTALMAFSRLKKSKPSVGQPHPNKKNSEIPKYLFFYFFLKYFLPYKTGRAVCSKIVCSEIKVNLFVDPNPQGGGGAPSQRWKRLG